MPSFRTTHKFMVYRSDGTYIGSRFSNLECAARTALFFGKKCGMYVREFGTNKSWDFNACAPLVQYANRLARW